MLSSRVAELRHLLGVRGPWTEGVGRHPLSESVDDGALFVEVSCSAGGFDDARDGEPSVRTTITTPVQNHGRRERFSFDVPMALFDRMLFEDRDQFLGATEKTGIRERDHECIRQTLEAGLDDPGAFYECFGFDVWCDELAMDKAWVFTLFETEDSVVREHRAAVHDFYFYELVDDMEANLREVHGQVDRALGDIGRKLVSEMARRSDACTRVQRAWRERSNSPYTGVGRRTILRRFPLS
jgi:hypothetical protein